MWTTKGKIIAGIIITVAIILNVILGLAYWPF